MAGDWLKMELELPDKPEVHAIASTLGLDPDAVVGKLFRVWSWFDKHTEDGNAYGVTFALVDRLTGVIGFGEAMSFAGWLEQRDKTLHMPKFDAHTSESAKKRALNARRQANLRKKSNAESNANSNASDATSASPREEKRREENIKEQNQKQGAGKPRFELPDWVPEQEWASYCEMRRKARHPLTDHAKKLILAELEKLRGDGHDPGAVLDQSTANAWRGVFPLKGRSTADEWAKATREVFGDAA